MAKKKSKPTADAAPEKKPKPAKQPSRAGAVFGSILLFLLTLLFSIALLCSSILHSLLPQHTLSGSISQMDLSQVQLKDNGKTEQLGKCLYDWYFWDAPNLTEEYADVLVQQPEFNALFCNYLDDLSDYLRQFRTAESERGGYRRSDAERPGQHHAERDRRCFC